MDRIVRGARIAACSSPRHSRGNLFRNPSTEVPECKRAAHYRRDSNPGLPAKTFSAETGKGHVAFRWPGAAPPARPKIDRGRSANATCRGQAHQRKRQSTLCAKTTRCLFAEAAAKECEASSDRCYADAVRRVRCHQNQAARWGNPGFALSGKTIPARWL